MVIYSSKIKALSMALALIIVCSSLVLGIDCDNFNKKKEYTVNNATVQIGVRQGSDTKYLLILDENCNPILDDADKYFEIYLVDEISSLILSFPENITSVEEFKNFLIRLKSMHTALGFSTEIARPYTRYVDDLLPYIKTSGKAISNLAILLRWDELYSTVKNIKQDGFISLEEVGVFKEDFGSLAINGILMFVAIEEKGAKRATAILLEFSPNFKESQITKLLDNWDEEIEKYPKANTMYQVLTFVTSVIVDQSSGLMGAALISVPAMSLKEEMRSQLKYSIGLPTRAQMSIKSTFNNIFKFLKSLWNALN